MKSRKLIEIIESGESTTVEFKRKSVSPEKIAKEMTAFANTKGGYLLIGVDDNSALYGVESEKTEIDIIEKATQFFIIPPIEPKVEVVNLLGQYEIVVVEIKESPFKPHLAVITSKNEFGEEVTLKRAYIRLGEKSVIASSEMYRLLKETYSPSVRNIKIYIGEAEKRLFSYLEAKERITVKEYAKLVNISKRRAERKLITLVRAGVLQIHNDSHNDYFTQIWQWNSASIMKLSIF